MRKNLFIALTSFFVCANAALGSPVAVVSPSFESPEVPTSVPALPFFVGWQHTPKPDWYVEDPNDPTTQWANFAGVFPNTAPGTPQHIENMDGNQAAYLFAVPSDGIYQDLTALYEVAHTYTLTVGLVQSSTFAPNSGSTLGLNFYYRDGAKSIVTISSQPVTFNSANFPSTTNLIYFTAKSPAVKATDPWVGKPLGIMLVSTTAPELAGGVWDIDNVKVTTDTVPNGSFESPVVPNTVPALPFFEAWQHTPKPDWYTEDPNDPSTQWANFAGVFPNPAAGSPGHIVNMDQNQAGYVFAVPSNGIYQELPSIFEPGFSYKVTAAFVGSSTFPPADGSMVQLSFYYRDGTNMITVASNSITYNSTNFPSLTNFVDFTVASPFVDKTNAWAGKPIGVAITSTFALAGGIWDVDNVRLTTESVPNGSFESPVVPNSVPALPFFEAWQHTPKPDWYTEDPNDPSTQWANFAGVFPNTAPGTPQHIENMDGNQAAYLFSVPSNGIFQEIPLKFEPGVSYTLSAGFVASSTFPPAANSTLLMSIYYMDGTNRVTMGSRYVVYTTNNFPSFTNFLNFTATSGLGNLTNKSIGKPIGIAFIADNAPAGGVWDIDNVRLTPNVLKLRIAALPASTARISFQAFMAVTYQLQGSADLIHWIDVGSQQVGTDAEVSIDVPTQTPPARFYRVRTTEPPIQ